MQQNGIVNCAVYSSTEWHCELCGLFMQQSGIYQLQIEDYTVTCCNFICEREEMHSCHSGFDKYNFIPHQEIAAVTFS
jgi:hypothetical protein